MGNIKKLYSNGRSNGYINESVTEDAFVESMKDPNQAKSYYDYVVSHGGKFNSSPDDFAKVVSADALAYGQPAATPEQPEQQKGKGFWGGLVDSMKRVADMNDSRSQAFYQKGAAVKEEEREAEAERRRVAEATLPLSDNDRQRETDMAQLRTRIQQDSQNADAYNQVLQQLEGDTPSYMKGEDASPDDVVRRYAEAWGANTPEGQQAVQTLNQRMDEVVAGFRSNFEQSKQYKDIYDAITKQYRSGRLTMEKANQQLNEQLNAAFMQQYGQAIEDEQRDLYNSFLNDARQHDNGYIKRESERIMSQMVNSQVDEGMNRLNRLVREKEEQFRAGLDMSRPGSAQALSNYQLSEGGGTLGAAAQLYREAATRMADTKTGEATFGSVISDFGRHILDKIPDLGSFGMSELSSSIEQKRVLEKIANSNAFDNPESVLTDEEDVLYDAIVAKVAAELIRSENTSHWASAAKLTGDMLPFVEEIMLGQGLLGGFTRSGKALAHSVARRLTTGTWSRVLGYIGGTFVNFAESAAIAAIAPSTYSLGVQNMARPDDTSITFSDGVRLNNIEQQGALPAFHQAYWNQVGELFTETGGNTQLAAKMLKETPVGRAIGKTALADMLRSFDKTAAGQLLSKGAYNGIVGEMSEEWENTFYDACKAALKAPKGQGAKAFADTYGEFVSADTQVPMLISFSIPAILGGAVSSGQYVKIQRDYTKAYEQIQQTLGSMGMSEEESMRMLDKFRGGMYTGNIDDIPAAINSMANAYGNTPEEKERLVAALSQYAVADTQLAALQTAHANEQSRVKELYRDVERVEQEIDGMTNEADGNIYHVGIKGKNDAVDGYITAGNVTTLADSEGHPRFSSNDVVTVRFADGSVQQMDASQLALIEAPEKGSDRLSRETKRLEAKWHNIDAFPVGSKVTVTGPMPVTTTVADVNDEGVVVDITDENGMPEQTTIPHEEAVQLLEAVQPNQDAVTFADESGETIELVDRGEGIYETAQADENGEYYTYTAEDLAGMGLHPVGEQQPADSGQPVSEQEPANQEQPSVPMDENGNPVWDQISSDDAANYILGTYQGNKAGAVAYADDMLAEAQKVMKNASKQKSKNLNLAERMQEEEIIKQMRQSANESVHYWEQVKLAIANIKTDEELAAEEERQAKMQAERQQRKQTTASVSTATTMAERYDDAQKIEGRKGTTTLADGTEVTGRYMLVAPDAVTPSHNPLRNYDMSEGYPQVDGHSINDRDYKNDPEEQQKVAEVAQQYNGNAIKNMPVVSDEGMVYNGNGRTMASMLAAQNNTDEAYMRSLKANAEQFGFTAEQVESIPHARVVFELDERLPYNTSSLAIFNANEQQTQSNTGKAASLTRKLTQQAISDVLDAVEPFETIDAFFNDARAPYELINSLINDGILSTRDHASFVDNGRLTATGKENLISILLGTALDEKTIRLLGSNAAVRNSVLRALPQILENKGLGEYSLFENINNAIAAIYDMDQRGMSFAEYTRQLLIDGTRASDAFTPFELLLADAMNNGGVQAFRDVLGLYNNSARDAQGGQLDIFSQGVTEPQDIINQILNKYGKEQEQPSGNRAKEAQSAVSSTPAGDGEEAGNVSRSLTSEQADELVDNMKEQAQLAPVVEFTPENYLAEFGEEGVVDTPIGKVKLSDNQYTKLIDRNRTKDLGMIKPTLTNPDVIIEKYAPKDGAERNTKYLFIKTFIKPDGTRILHYESISVRKDNQEISVSNHEAEEKDIKKEMQNGNILHLRSGLPFASEWSLGERLRSDGSDLVPTPSNSERKGSENNAPAQEKSKKSAENSAILLTDGRSVTAETAKTGDFYLLPDDMSLIQKMLFAQKANTAQGKDPRGIGAGYRNEVRHVVFDSLSDSDISSVEAVYRKTQEEYVNEPNKTDDYKSAADDVLKEIYSRLQYLDKEGKYEHGTGSSTKSRLAEAELAFARKEVDTNPTDAQKEAGNYKKGHVNLFGFDITLENPKGSTRSGKDADGKAWSITMQNDYGYIRGTESVDGDHIDIYLGDNTASEKVFVMDAINQKTGAFDEHKVLLGFDSADAALEAYLANYEKGWKPGTLTEVSLEEFRKWIESSHRKTKPFGEYKSVKREAGQGEGSGKTDFASLRTDEGHLDWAKIHSMKAPMRNIDEEVHDAVQFDKKANKKLYSLYKAYSDAYKEFVPLNNNALAQTGKKRTEAEAVAKKAEQVADAAFDKLVPEIEKITDGGLLLSMAKLAQEDGKFHVEDRLYNRWHILATTPEMWQDIKDAFSAGWPYDDVVSYVTARYNPRFHGNSRAIVDYYQAHPEVVEKGVLGVEGVTTPAQGESTAKKKPEISENVIFTESAADKARARMRARLGRLNAGLDPEMLSDGIIVAGYYIERGARTFAAYAKAMIHDFGDAIRPYLKGIYTGLSMMPEAKDLQMDDMMTVAAFDVDNFDPDNEPEPPTGGDGGDGGKPASKFQEGDEVTYKGKPGFVVNQILANGTYALEYLATRGQFMSTILSGIDEKHLGFVKKAQQSEENSPNGEEKSGNVSPSQKKFVSLQGKSVNLDTADWRTYMTDEAKAVIPDGEKFVGFKRRNLAYITQASWDHAIIPYEALMEIPEIKEAQEKVDTQKDSLKISEEEEKEHIAHLLDAQHGSAVFEGKKIRKVNGAEDFSGEVAQERKAFIIIGRPAGGKSSVYANPLSNQNKARIIDSDVVKPWLKGFDGGDGAGFVNEASAKVADHALWVAAEQGDNIVIPKIGGLSVIETALMLKKMGYDISLYYNDVPSGISIIRSASRFAETGRYLSLDYLNGIGDKPLNTFTNFANLSTKEALDEYIIRYVEQENKKRDKKGLPRLEQGELVDLWRNRGFNPSGGSSVQGVGGEEQTRISSRVENGPLFSFAEWKNNDVAFGAPPVLVWSSESTEPIPGTDSVRKDMVMTAGEGMVGSIRKGKHTKTGEDLWIVSPSERLSDADFKDLKKRARENDGYYSKFKENRGFVFTSEDAANKFNNLYGESITAEEYADSEVARDEGRAVSREGEAYTDGAGSAAEEANERADAGADAEQSVEDSKKEAEINEQIAKVDEAIQAIDDQLAILGALDTTDGVNVHVLDVTRRKHEEFLDTLLADLNVEKDGEFDTTAEVLPRENWLHSVSKMPTSLGVTICVNSKYELDEDNNVRSFNGVVNIQSPGGGNLETAYFGYGSTYQELLEEVSKMLGKYRKLKKRQTPLEFSKEKKQKPKSKKVPAQATMLSLFDDDLEPAMNLAMVTAEEQQAAEEQSNNPETIEDNGSSDSSVPPQDGGMGEGEQQTAIEPEQERVGTGSESDLLHDGERSGSDARQHVSEDVTPAPKVVHNKNNFHNSRGKSLAPTTPKARFDANVAAIRLMRELTESGKKATAKDKAILTQYSGWGGLGTYFNNRWSPEYKTIHELFDADELHDAENSINTAYYTPTYIIDYMWDIVSRMGFKGGDILEGSAGIGNILAQIPTAINQGSSIQAVELDQTTGNILRLLYPDAQVNIDGFQNVDVRPKSKDLVITNVPFDSSLKLTDEKNLDITDKFGLIHNFCIAKNVRALREGGIGVFITTSGTLDKAPDLFKWLGAQEKTDVVGAFRLNNKTFDGAPVTSDIIVVRKRINGERSPQAIDVTAVHTERIATYDENPYSWRQTKDKDLIRIPITYNNYFVEHPEHMGGVMMANCEMGDTFRPKSIGLHPKEGKDQAKLLKAWVNTFAEQVQAEKPQEDANREATKDKEGSLLVNSKGEICVSQSGAAVPLDVKSGKVGGRTKAECLHDYQEVRDALNAVLDYQATNADDKGLKPLLDKLNAAYDLFHKRYGNFHKNNMLSWLRNDVDYSAVAETEVYKESEDANGKKTASVEKAGVMNGRVLRTKTEQKASNVRDGIVVSIREKSRIDLGYIASLLGRNVEDVRTEALKTGLAFEDPVSGDLVVKYEYLSGNVLDKLEQAKASNTDGRYDDNVRELERVCPKTIPAHMIKVSFGSTWVPANLYKDYIAEKTGIPAQHIRVQKLGAEWSITLRDGAEYTSSNVSNGVHSKQLNMTIPVSRLVIAAINNGSVAVSKVVNGIDGKHTEVDKEATQVCNSRIDQYKDEFVTWFRDKMQADPEMAAQIENDYNKTFNQFVPTRVSKEFIPDYFDGANQIFKLNEWQSQAAVRCTMEPLMIAHEVGTGKTFTMITSAMEMRRLGLAKKPMIVVQNATVQQFVADARRLYPRARILSMTDKDKGADGRAAFYRKIKYNDWDIIIITQSAFNMIPESQVRKEQYIQEKIEEKEHIIELLEAEKVASTGSDARTIDGEIKRLRNEITNALQSIQEAKEEGKVQKTNKQAKKQAARIESITEKAKRQLARKTDDVESFDDMDIDALFVDEAHEYKHLGFESMTGWGIKGIDKTASGKAVSLYCKMQAVFDKTGHKNVVFATGTPISNTAAEIWTFMKYLMPKDVLKANQIYYFDDFVHNFGKITQRPEFKTNGSFKEVTRFAEYNNVPELVRMWTRCSDTVLEPAGLKDKVPVTEAGGKSAQDIFLPQTRALRSVMKYVRERLEEYEKMDGAKKKENSHIPLTMYGIAMRAAIDPRLVLNAADEPTSKTNRAVDEVIKALDDSRNYNGTVAVFCDSFQRKENGVVTFNLFDDIREKLIARGIPAEQIAIISNQSKEKKQQIFDKVNAGEIRVILGSTQKLGVGVNIQTRLFAEIHLDAPNRPMDYQQRVGRIIRQGNLHKEWGIPVRLIRFGVEDSLDVTGYQRLKTKTSFSTAIMKSANDMNLDSQIVDGHENRSMEEDDSAAEFDNMIATISGSEFAILKSDAERKLRKLEAEKKQFDDNRIWLADAIKRNNFTIQSAEERKKELENTLGKIRQTFPDGKVTSVKVAGKNMSSDKVAEETYKKLNEAINEKRETLRLGGVSAMQYTDSYKPLTTVEFELNGVKGHFRVMANVSILSNGVDVRTYHDVTIPELGIEQEATKQRFIKGDLETVLSWMDGKGQEARIRDMQYRIDTAKKENESHEEKLTRTFDKEADIEKLQADVDMFTEKMKAEMEAKEAKYREMDKEVESVNLGDTIDLSDDDEDEAEKQYGDGYDNDTEAQQLATEAVMEALENAGINVVLEQEDVELAENAVQMAAVNDKFNRTIMAVDDKGLHDVVFNLGMPSDMLLAAGIADKPIRLYGSKIQAKMKKHGLTKSELLNLPMAVSNPIAVFVGNGSGHSVLTELSTKEGNVLVAIKVGEDQDADFDIVKSVYGKGEEKIVRWINEGKMLAVNKEKALDYLRTPAPIAGTASDQELNSAAKIVQNFDTAKSFGEKSENLSDISEAEFSIRKGAAPKKTGIGYKVFYRGKDGKLYPPMVANPNGADTPVGVWLNADAAPMAGLSKTGRPQVKAGGKGTQGGSGSLAYRPGWHLGEIPYAIQFNRMDENGNKTLFPKDFVWAEVEYAADVDYQKEAEIEGINANGKFQHSLAGLKRVPEDGYYRYRTNPNPATDPWIITGAMKVKRVLTNDEVDEIVRKAGREPQLREMSIVGGSDIFVSNAAAALGRIKQEKATPEQWLAMLTKEGGIKAGEDKWMGLSDWLKGSTAKTITKKEVMNFIRENAIQIEEVQYTEDYQYGSRDLYEDRYELGEIINDSQEFNEYYDEFYNMVEEEGMDAEDAYQNMIDKYGDEFEEAFEYYYGELTVKDQDAAISFLGIELNNPDPGEKRINETRLTYTTYGLDNKREIALTVPTIEPWMVDDNVHFGDAGNGRAVAWVRFGETTDEDGKRVLVIDEIQSKRHQEGREHGYKQDNNIHERYDKASDEYQAYYNMLRDKYDVRNRKDLLPLITFNEARKLNELEEKVADLRSAYYESTDYTRGVPNAPFDKNWPELAFKRMLRLAAEEGYDRVAWTTGKQQADRYDLRGVVEEITVSNEGYDYYLQEWDEVKLRSVNILLQNENRIKFDINGEGQIISSVAGQYDGRTLADVVGKEMAVKILSVKNEDFETTFRGGDLEIGGEGMKAFYDQMLPSFVKKYVKKWGATVEDVTLPNVEEAGRVMHSVTITPEMRESVMQGQPQFLYRTSGTVLGWADNTGIHLTPNGVNPNTPIHEYTHLWAKAMELRNPEGWESIKSIFRNTPFWDEVVNDINYRNIRNNEDRICSEVLARYSGKRGAERMTQTAQELLDEAKASGSKLAISKTTALLRRVKEAIQSFWNWVGHDLFGIHSFKNADEVADRVLYDLVSGTDLSGITYGIPEFNITPEELAKRREAMRKWQKENPVPKLRIGETLEQFQQRLNEWKAKKAEQNKPDPDGPEGPENPGGGMPPVPPVPPTRLRPRETGKEFSARRKAEHEMLRDSVAIADYTAFTNDQLSKLQKKIRKFADAAKPIEDFLGIMMRHGCVMNDDSNPYWDYHQANSRATILMEIFKRDIEDPMSGQIRRVVKKYNLEDFGLTWHNLDVEGTGQQRNGDKVTAREFIGLYTQAKDAEEAEELGLPDRGQAGFKKLLDVDYKEIIGMMESTVAKEDIDKLWELINKATKFALVNDYEAGRITKDVYEENIKRKYYVPQRGWRERDESGLLTDYLPIGKRYGDAYNAALIKSHGRSSLASDPFQYIISIAHSSIVSSENNNIKQKLLNFCLLNEDFGIKTGAFHVKTYWLMTQLDENGNIKYEKDENGNERPILKIEYAKPDEKVFEHDKQVKQQITKRERYLTKLNKLQEAETNDARKASRQEAIEKVLNEISALEDTMMIAWTAVDTNLVHQTKGEKQQHWVCVMKDGQMYELEFPRNATFANAINKSWRTHQEELLSTNHAMRNATRIMSAMMTQYNPEFAMSNFVRDYQVAVATIAAEHPEMLQDFLKNFAQCQRAVTVYAWNDRVRDRFKYVDSEIGRYLEEYMRVGAPTGYSYMKDLKALNSDFEALIKQNNFKKGFHGAIGMFSVLTEMSETSVRFAFYMTARQHGMGKNEAAFKTKELTTNFDRAGESANNGWMAWYSFFRATMNGNIKFFRAFKKMPKAYAIAAAVYFAAGLINQLANPDDPDDEIMVNDYVREGNFVVGKVKIPVAHFMRMFFAAGVNMGAFFQGSKTWNKAIFDTADYAMGELLPDYLNVIGNIFEWDDSRNTYTGTWEGLALGFVPTPFKPLAEVGLNRDFKGATINKEPFSKAQEGMKDVHLGKDGTRDTYKYLSQFVYEMAGGDMTTTYKSDDNEWTSMFDISPSTYEHLSDQYLVNGAAETFVAVSDMILSATSGNGVSMKQVPFLRKFYNSYDTGTAYRQQYYMLNGRVKEFDRNLKDYEKNNPTKYNQVVRSQQYKLYEKDMELLSTMKENPTKEDVKKLYKANQEWWQKRK